jgi:hypothetical protein
MRLRASLISLSTLACAQAWAYAAPLSARVVFDVPFVSSSCLADISVADGKVFCVFRPGAQEENVWFVGNDEQLIYVEADFLPEGLSPVLSEGDKHLAVVKKSEWEALRTNGSVFAFPIDLSDSPTMSHRALSQPLSFEMGDKEIVISRESLRENLEILVGERSYVGQSGQIKIPERFSANGRKLARDVFSDFFTALGMTVRNQCYGQGTRAGCNFEATLEGETAENPIVVGAHYDSVTTGAADDNGTGTAALMEIARNMAQQKHKRTVKFVAFDQEELGLVGSAAYVKDVVASPDTTPSLAFTMDMIGFDSDNDGKLHVVDCGRQESVPLSELFLRQAEKQRTRLSNSKTCTNRTDHSSFWGKKIPAIAVAENFFGGDGNKCYHKSCDTIANMNFDYFARIAQASANTVLTLANQ